MAAVEGVRWLTAPRAGAVAVLEVTGALARERLTALAGRGLPEPGHLRLAALAVAGELLDEALLVARPDGPLELHLHGGPAVVARVTEVLGGLAQPTVGRRWQERAAALLPNAPSEDGARILLDQVEGALERALAGALGRPALEASATLAELARRGRLARPLLVAPRLVLAGPTNAGKSTLFNLLVGAERAITSEVPGTTRDAVVERARLGHLGVELVDTAGERELSGELAPVAEVEAAGQALAARLRTGADLVLWLSHLDRLAAGPSASSSQPPWIHFERRPGARRADPRSDRVAPLEDPLGTRALVEARVAKALPHEGWSPGRAVPFEEALVDALERLSRERDDRRRDAELERWIEGLPEQ